MYYLFNYYIRNYEDVPLANKSRIIPISKQHTIMNASASRPIVKYSENNRYIGKDNSNI